MKYINKSDKTLSFKIKGEWVDVQPGDSVEADKIFDPSMVKVVDEVKKELKEEKPKKKAKKTRKSKKKINLIPFLNRRKR